MDSAFFMTLLAAEGQTWKRKTGRTSDPHVWVQGRGGAWVSGLVSEFWAQVPNTQGASSPHSLILSGLWEAQAVQEIQVPPQELWIVEGAHVVPISPWFEASRG